MFIKYVFRKLVNGVPIDSWFQCVGLGSVSFIYESGIQTLGTLS